MIGTIYKEKVISVCFSKFSIQNASEVKVVDVLMCHYLS